MCVCVCVCVCVCDQLQIFVLFFQKGICGASSCFCHRYDEWGMNTLFYITHKVNKSREVGFAVVVVLLLLFCCCCFFGGGEYLCCFCFCCCYFRYYCCYFSCFYVTMKLLKYQTLICLRHQIKCNNMPRFKTYHACSQMLISFQLLEIPRVTLNINTFTLTIFCTQIS